MILIVWSDLWSDEGKFVLPWSCEGRTYFCCLVMTCYDERLTVIIAVKGTHGKSFVIIWWWGVRAIFSVFSYYLLHSSVALTCKISFKKPFVRKKVFMQRSFLFLSWNMVLFTTNIDRHYSVLFYQNAFHFSLRVVEHVFQKFPTDFYRSFVVLA